MKHVKSYIKFLEDVANASTAGMGDVVSSQPGDLPGTTGTTGSGDVSSYLMDKKGKKIKKGKPNEVSDLRFLEPTTEITKLEEGLDYNNIEEYISDIRKGFGEFNIRPIVLNSLMDKYSDIINDFYQDGKLPSDFVKMISSDIGLDKDDKFPSVKYGIPNNSTLKYL